MNIWTHEQWLDLDAWEAELEADAKVTIVQEPENDAECGGEAE